MNQPFGTLDGIWNLSIVTPLGTQTARYEFVSGETGLSGTVMQGADLSTLVDLQLSGNRLTWTQHVTKPMKLKLNFEVVLNGDILSGVARANPLPASKVQGVRVQS